MKRLFVLLLLCGLVTSGRAREVFPLNEGWRFFFKTERTSDNARHVTLPHSWNTDPRALGYWLETTGNYQNTIFLPLEWASKRIFLKFYGVQSVADLFVNGSYVGSHRGAATAFTFEITDKVRFGADNGLLVVVSNSYRDDVLPTSTDMNLYGGIFRDVELIATETTAISPLYFGSDGVLVHPRSVDGERAEGEIEVHITSKQESNCMLNIQIENSEGRTVFARRQKVHIEDEPVMVPFAIENPELGQHDDKHHHPQRYAQQADQGNDGKESPQRVQIAQRQAQADVPAQ